MRVSAKSSLGQRPKQEKENKPVTEITVRIVGERANYLMELQRIVGGWDSVPDMIVWQITNDIGILDELVRNETDDGEKYLRTSGKLTAAVVKK
jgi:hypothetical protein